MMMPLSTLLCLLACILLVAQTQLQGSVVLQLIVFEVVSVHMPWLDWFVEHAPMPSMPSTASRPSFLCCIFVSCLFECGAVAFSSF
jgi:hypothetical protein